MGRTEGLGQDVVAGAIVMLVALPLCLGIALASGAPLVSGLITGIVGGLVVSWLGGTQLLVSGPAAGLAAIVVAAIAELGAFEAFLAAVVVAGVLQLGMGLVRAGRFAALVPSSVVTGMLAAIGVLLILQQIPHALGVTPDGHAHGLGLFAVIPGYIASAAVGPAIVGLSCLALLFVWKHPRVPGPLVAVVFGTVLAAVFGQTEALAIPAALYVDLPEAAGMLTWPDFSALSSSATWRVAVTLAIVASIETLLSMEATDRMDPLKRRSDGNRELVGQGVGNLVSGLLGGLPMTGVIVRSTVNISSGGRTWRSALVHGILLVVAVLAVPWLLELIPLAALAAVLLHTGYKLAHPSRFAAAWQIGPRYAVPLYGTVAAVVVTDLLIGVMLGIVACVVTALVTLARHGEHGVEIDQSEDTVRVHLARAVSFFHKPRLREALEDLSEGAAVTVDGSNSHDIDHDVVEFLHTYARDARERGIEVRLIGVPAPAVAAAH